MVIRHFKVQFCSLDNATELQLRILRGMLMDWESQRFINAIMRLGRAGLFPSLSSSTQVCGTLDPFTTAPRAKRNL